jgi:hypothetical protein
MWDYMKIICVAIYANSSCWRLSNIDSILHLHLESEGVLYITLGSSIFHLFREETEKIKERLNSVPYAYRAYPSSEQTVSYPLMQPSRLSFPVSLLYLDLETTQHKI